MSATCHLLFCKTTIYSVPFILLHTPPPSPTYTLKNRQVADWRWICQIKHQNKGRLRAWPCIGSLGGNWTQYIFHAESISVYTRGTFSHLGHVHACHGYSEEKCRSNKTFCYPTKSFSSVIMVHFCEARQFLNCHFPSVTGSKNGSLFFFGTIHSSKVPKVWSKTQLSPLIGWQIVSLCTCLFSIISMLVRHKCFGGWTHFQGKYTPIGELESSTWRMT